MKSVSETIKFAARSVLVVLAATMPGIAASAEGPAPTNTRASTAAFDERDIGSPFWDGSRQMPGNAQIGATPAILAIMAGVTCNFRYVVRNGKRVKEKYCEDTR